MTLQDIIDDIHAMREDLEIYERKYGILSETFYQMYISGEEPEDDSWVLDWSDWAGAYRIYQHRLEEYHRAIETLKRERHTMSNVLKLTARHESLSVAS